MNETLAAILVQCKDLKGKISYIDYVCNGKEEKIRILFSFPKENNKDIFYHFCRLFCRNKEFDVDMESNPPGQIGFGKYDYVMLEFKESYKLIEEFKKFMGKSQK